MSKVVYTDRSRIESFQRCNRLRWLEYHQNGQGIASAKKSLPLAVGGAVHRGLEVLLRAMIGEDPSDEWHGHITAVSMRLEDQAVDAAISDLAQYRGSLALDTSEALAQASAVPVPDDVMRSQLAESLGMSIEDAGLDALMTTQQGGQKAFDEYLWREQSALVEGLVRAYARRRLRPLLEEFEVLEVEREGTWELAGESDSCPQCDSHNQLNRPTSCHDAWHRETLRGYSIVFCSRPDALLRSRSDNSLYLMSFKTAATWDRRKELDAQHDMQGLSEGVEVERRLGEWWHQLHTTKIVEDGWGMSYAMREYLSELPSPPRILGIRYEYLLKGYRGEDKDLSARFGFKVWSQRSHLVRRYRAVSLPKKGEGGFSLGDYCWSFDYLREDGMESKLYYGHWKSEPVDNVKAWIDMLDDFQEAMSAYDSTVGQEPRPMGWKSRGQALGYTKEHPLDAIFIPPITVYRNDDDLRDWLEQTEAQEVRVAEAVAEVEAATDSDEERSALNRLFPMTRRACEYPTSCSFVKVCYAGEEMKRDPLASGLYVRRQANHEAEREAWSGVEQERGR